MDTRSQQVSLLFWRRLIALKITRLDQLRLFLKSRVLPTLDGEMADFLWKLYDFTDE